MRIMFMKRQKIHALQFSLNFRFCAGFEKFSTYFLKESEWEWI